MRRLLALLFVLLPATIGPVCFPSPEPESFGLTGPPPRALTSAESDQVLTLVGRRCVVCHGCYDAPCQLILSSREGLHRGANKARVYHSSRLIAAQPTRLDFDAHTPEGWEKLGFFRVDTGSDENPTSLILGMLALGRAYDFAPGRPLPSDFPLALDRRLECPNRSEFADYVASTPRGGMPYGMASLPDDEYQLLATWAAADAPTPPIVPLAPELVAEIDELERLLNLPGLKQRVVARYLYEHWVFADLYFPSFPNGPFFEVVRSRTPPGQPIDVIATRFPFDPPGVDHFWYRIRRQNHLIVHKTHITYELGAKRRARIAELFFGEDWEATHYPSFEPEVASNPFLAFAEIPARARYQFLLEDAEYFVSSFIRGPVCRGQAATDVIQDRFFVSFLAPDYDVSIIDPTFLPSVAKDLRLPADAGPNLSLLAAWKRYDRSQTRYRKARYEAYTKLMKGRGTQLDMIWNGNGYDRDAFLTVFRNSDNAMVLRGFIGDIPKTAWVMDYPIFERIYYDLVAGFDVFGNVGHQLGVRFYMDNLRMESEDLFLAFLPAPLREPMRDSWYVGATEETKYVKVNPLRSQNIRTDIPYRTDDPKRELIEMLLARNPVVSGPRDWINRCYQSPCERPGASALEREAERSLRRIPSLRGTFAGNLPEVVYLRVRGARGAEAAYTLTLDRGFTNVAAIFREEARRAPDEDAVTVVPGLIGSYPNFAFDLRIEDLPDFVNALMHVTRREDLIAMVDRWGVRRSSPHFWETSDWMHDELIRENPREAGILDLNRYQNL